MKTLKFYYLLVALAFLSCSNEEDICYSCDENIDAWVKEKRDSFENITYSQFLEYDGDKQRAIFRSLSATKKKDLWLDRMTDLKTAFTSKKDIEIINFVENILLNELTYSDLFTDELYLNYEKQIVNLAKEANWSRVQVVLSFSSFNSIYENKSLDDDPAIVDAGPDLGQGQDCHCKWGYFSCMGDNKCDKKSKCEETESGCGLLWLQDCNGYCNS